MNENESETSSLLKRHRLLLAACVDLRLSNADKTVLAVIFRYMRKDQEFAFPALSTIAKNANIDRRTATRAIQNLVGRGYLQRESGDARTTNIYRPGELTAVADDGAGSGGMNAPSGKHAPTRRGMSAPSIGAPVSISVGAPVPLKVGVKALGEIEVGEKQTREPPLASLAHSAQATPEGSLVDAKKPEPAAAGGCAADMGIPISGQGGQDLLGADGALTAKRAGRKGPGPAGQGEADGWDEFWSAYPRRVARGAAVKAWNKLKPSPELRARILRALAAQKPAWAANDPRFTPHAATWLNAARWDDEPDQPAAAQPSKAMQILAGLNDFCRGAERTDAEREMDTLRMFHRSETNPALRREIADRIAELEKRVEVERAATEQTAVQSLGRSATGRGILSLEAMKSARQPDAGDAIDAAWTDARSEREE